MTKPVPPLWQRAIWRLQWMAVLGVRTLILLLSPDAGERAARFAARAYYRVAGSRRRTAIENIRVAFGDAMTPERRDRLARASFEHIFVLLLEVVTRERLAGSMRVFESTGVITGDLVEARETQRSGVGGFLMTAHVGNWEVAGAFLANEGIPLAAIARSVPNPYVQDLLTGTRQRAFTVFEKRGAVKDSLEFIRRGGWVAVLGDQNAGRHGVYVPFFGVVASTYPLTATLAVRHGLQVYFGAAIRRGPRFRYTFPIHKYRAPVGLSQRDATMHLLETYHQWLETLIRETPEQYFWMHRRWKTRPVGETPGPHLPQYDHRGPRGKPSWRRAAARKPA